MIRLMDAALHSFFPASADAKQFIVRGSSGTSESGPLLSVSKLNTTALRAWLGGDERTLVCYGPRGTRLFNLLGAVFFQNQCLLVDGDDITSQHILLLDQFAPNRIVGFPTFVIRVAALMTPATRNAITSLHVSGEMLGESMERALREYFPQALLKVQYVASEIGPISEHPCGYLPRNHFHINRNVTVEIESPDEHGVGDLLISKVLYAGPVIRYRVGDIGRLYSCACACGATSALEVFGRSGRDYVKLAGGLLRAEEFERVMAKYKGVVQDYRVEAATLLEKGLVQGKVSVFLYCGARGPTPALQKEIVQTISTIFVTPTRTLAQLVEQGLFAPLEVSIASKPFTEGHKASRLRYRI